MKFSVACSKLPWIALAIAMISAAACAKSGSERSGAICPPTAPYSARVQEQAAAELDVLPRGSAIEAMLVDYSVLRAQTRLCSTGTEAETQGLGSTAMGRIADICWRAAGLNTKTEADVGCAKEEKGIAALKAVIPCLSRFAATRVGYPNADCIRAASMAIRR